VRIIRSPIDLLLYRVESLRHCFNSLEEAQSKALKELQNFAVAAENARKLRNQPLPPANPNGEDFIPKPEPQVPFHQVEPNIPGEGLAPGSEIPWLGATVEPNGLRGDASNLGSTLSEKAYSDPATEQPQGPPMSELWGKGPKGPRPGQPTFPQPAPKARPNSLPKTEAEAEAEPPELNPEYFNI
jgi:hypothetical protein